MSEFRVAKLEALLARVLERSAAPRVVAVAPVAAAPVEVVAPVEAPRAPSIPPVSMHHAATTPPPPPVAVPAVSIPRQPLPPTDDFQESTHVSSRVSGPELVPNAAESHARIATASRVEEPSFPSADEESSPVSSERTVDPSVEADTDLAAAPPESTRQLATSPPARPSVIPDSAPRSVQSPVVTRGSLPPDAQAAVEFEGEVAVKAAKTVGDLLDDAFSL